MSIALPISRLTLASNTVKRSGIDYFGPENGYTFWKVSIDEEVVSEIAQPFSSTDFAIELNGNTYVPIWGDGDGLVSVRSVSDKLILWCRPIITSLEYFLHKAALPDERFFVFDFEQYSEAIKQIASTIQDEVGGDLNFSHTNQAQKINAFRYFANKTGQPTRLPPPLSKEDLGYLLKVSPHFELFRSTTTNIA